MEAQARHLRAVRRPPPSLRPSPAPCLAHLAQHPDEFLAYLEARGTGPGGREAMSAVQWAFYDVDPARAPALYRSKKSRVCGLAWGKGTMAYRCRDCQTSDSSCICLACFEQGDHVGHDYALYNSGFGGCCDCGDPLAWRAAGNCRNHGPDVRPDPLPDAVVAAAAATSAVLWRYVVEALPRGVPLAVALCEWLRDACKVSDHLREALTGTAQALAPVDGRNPLVQALLSVSFSSRAPRQVLDAATNLCLELMFHAPFKAFFAHEFVPSLLLFRSAGVLAGSDEQQELWLYNLATISSQFFHVEELVLQLCQHRRLLDTTLDVAHSLLAARLAPRGPGAWQTLEAAEVPHAAIVQRFLSDARQLLQHPKVLVWFLSGSAPAATPDFALLLATMRLVQGAAAAERRAEGAAHVELETEAWLNAWNLAMPLSLVTDVLAPGVNLLAAAAGPEPDAALRAVRASLFGPLAAAALEWQHAQPPWPSGGAGGELLSFHLPLTRLLFRALHLYLARRPAAALAATLPLSGAAQWLDLASGPARVWAGVAGVRAGLWRRNGERTMQGQASLYRTAYWSVGADVDLYALQCAVAVAGAAAAVPFIVAHYAPLGPLADLSAPAGAAQGAHLVMMEEAIACLAAVACNRTWSGEEERLRREVVHQLALKELSRGQLLGKLSFEFRHEADAPLDAALRAVAEHTGGGADGTGRYRLRREAWAEVDPFYAFYSRADSQAVHERYNAAVKAPRPVLLPFPRPGPLLPPYARVAELATSDAVWRLLYAVLHHAAFRPELAAEALLEVTLYFLAATLHIAPGAPPDAAPAPAPADAPPASVLAELTWRGESAAARLAEEVRVAGRPPHSMASLLAGLLQRAELADRHEAIERLLRAAGLARLLPAAGPAADDEASKRRAAAAARKAAILAQFQAKQHDFEAAGAGAPGDEDDEEEEEAVCVLCKEHGSPARPLGLLATPLRSRQLALSARAGRLAPATPAGGELAASAPLDVSEPAARSEAAQHALSERIVEEESAMGAAVSNLMPSNDPALVSFLISLLSRDQRATLLRQAPPPPLPAFPDAIGRSAGAGDAVVLRSCGHAMHSACAARHLATRETALLHGPPTAEDCLLDTGDGEMQCPLCRQVSSALVLLIDDAALRLAPAAPLPAPLDALTAFLATPPPAVPPAPPLVTLPAPPAAAQGADEDEDEDEDEGEDEDDADDYDEDGNPVPRDADAAAERRRARRRAQRQRERLPPEALTRALFRRTHELLTRRLVGSDVALALHAAAVFVQQVAALELAARSHPAAPLALPRAQRALLAQLLKNAVTVASHSTAAEPELAAALRSAIRVTLGPPAPNDSRLLTSDAFAVLVHWLLFCAPRPLPADLAAFVGLLHLASVMQALLLAAYALGSPAPAPPAAAPPAAAPLDAPLRSPLDLSSLPALFASLAAHVGLAVPAVAPADLAAHVARVCTPFLARVRLLLDALDALAPDQRAPPALTYAALCQSLRLPAPADLLSAVARSPVLAALAARWLPLTSLAAFDAAKWGGELAWAVEWRPQAVRLTALPDNFQELFHRYKEWRCGSCNTAAQDTALCLHCSRLLCVGPQLTCCRDANGLGETFRHSLECSGGLGLFLLARQSGVLVTAGRRSVVWGSVYLDSHDEPDLLFKRGKPLHLSAPLVEKLVALVAEHRQEEAVFRSGATVPVMLRGQPAIVTTRL